MMSAACGKRAVRRTASRGAAARRPASGLVPVDPAGVEVVLGAVRAQHHGAVPLGADQQEADAGVVGEGGAAGRGARRSISSRLIRPRHVGEGDQPEVAGGEHHRIGRARRPSPSRSRLLDRPVQRGPRPPPAPRLRCGCARPAAGTGSPQPARTRSSRREAVARQRRSRPGSGRGRRAARCGTSRGACSATLAISASAAVEAAQHLVGVPAARPGVVGDLVVRHQVGVDRGAPGEHVPDHRGDDDVALDDGREGADERVQPAPPDARRLRRSLARSDWAISRTTSATKEHRGADGVGRVGEVREVAAPGSGCAGRAGRPPTAPGRAPRRRR